MHTHLFVRLRFLNENALASLDAGTFNGLDKLAWLYVTALSAAATAAPSGTSHVRVSHVAAQSSRRLHENELRTLANGTFAGLPRLNKL